MPHFSGAHEARQPPRATAQEAPSPASPPLQPPDDRTEGQLTAEGHFELAGDERLAYVTMMMTDLTNKAREGGQPCETPEEFLTRDPYPVFKEQETLLPSVEMIHREIHRRDPRDPCASRAGMPVRALMAILARRPLLEGDAAFVRRKDARFRKHLERKRAKDVAGAVSGGAATRGGKAPGDAAPRKRPRRAGGLGASPPPSADSHRAGASGDTTGGEVAMAQERGADDGSTSPRARSISRLLLQHHRTVDPPCCHEKAAAMHPSGEVAAAQARRADRSAVPPASCAAADGRSRPGPPDLTTTIPRKKRFLVHRAPALAAADIPVDAAACAHEAKVGGGNRSERAPKLTRTAVDDSGYAVEGYSEEEEESSDGDEDGIDEERDITLSLHDMKYKHKLELCWKLLWGQRKKSAKKTDTIGELAQKVLDDLKQEANAGGGKLYRKSTRRGNSRHVPTDSEAIDSKLRLFRYSLSCDWEMFPSKILFCAFARN